MKIKNSVRMMRPARFWIDGVTYNIGKGEDKVKYIKTETNQGRILSSFRLPTTYYYKIYKDPKFNLASIKLSSSTEVLLPKEGTDGNVIISGDNVNDVADAMAEFHSLLQSIRQNISPRQFIAVPTLSQEVKENFTKFKHELLSKNIPIPGLEETVFQKAEKLHITVCVFALLDEIEIEAAIKCLDELKVNMLLPFFQDKTPEMKLKGLSAMDTNVKKTNILYAKAKLVNETDDYNLQIICNKISDFFYEKGFLKELRDSVKIHVTLINTKYRKTPDSPKKKWNRWNKRIPIDATSIMQEYADYDFGTCKFDTVHLSLMSHGTAAPTEDGFYAPLSIATVT